MSYEKYKFKGERLGKAKKNYIISSLSFLNSCFSSRARCIFGGTKHVKRKF